MIENQVVPIRLASHVKALDRKINKNSIDPEKIYVVSEVARFLRCSLEKAHYLVRNRYIKCFLLNSTYRVEGIDIIKYIDQLEQINDFYNDGYLNMSQAAAYLNCSYTTIKRMVENKRLPCIKVSNIKLIHKMEIEYFVKDKKNLFENGKTRGKKTKNNEIN